MCAAEYIKTGEVVVVEYKCFSYDQKLSFDICSKTRDNIVVFCCFDEAECNRNFTTNPFATEATEATEGKSSYVYDTCTLIVSTRCMVEWTPIKVHVSSL